MTGIIIILAISWLLLYLIEREHILVLGFLPFIKRFKQFSIGFLVTATLCVLVQLFEGYLTSSAWTINDNITPEIVLKTFWWDFKSVLTEELIFRGALLYILIQKIGTSKSILVSAALFGIYHWFSFGIFGNLMAMVLVFIGTGLMGYAWAWAYSKTKSIMLPFGLHLGWNFIYNTIFSKGPLGEMVFISVSGNELTGLLSLLNFVNGLILVPTIVLLYVKYLVKKEADK